jgi:hypothetical protein
LKRRSGGGRSLSLAIKPKKAILTHFGMGMLKKKPHLLEKKIRKELGMDISFAYDGMTLNFPL